MLLIALRARADWTRARAAKEAARGKRAALDLRRAFAAKECGQVRQRSIHVLRTDAGRIHLRRPVPYR
jgi:hypothetical protein